MLEKRLKEERERLGLTQDGFSAAAGAKRRTLVDWEKGVSSPTAVQLSALSEIGVDVLYVITGQRLGAAAPAPTLAPDEAALLDNYRHSPKEAREALKATSDVFAKSPGCVKKGKAA